jgi:hypothetical protein
MLRPELDVVRHTYDDDPDGGDFDGAPDNGLDWLLDQLDRWRERRSQPRHAAV